MKTKKNRRFFPVIIAAAAFLAALFLVILFSSLSAVKHRVRFSQTYYFLVKDCEKTSAAAVSGNVSASGGAGYYLKSAGAVVVACYFEETDALNVQKSLLEGGTETRLYKALPHKAVLRGKECAEERHIAEIAETVDSVARLIYDAANGLEKQETTQNEARTALDGAKNAIAGLVESNKKPLYKGVNIALEEAQRRCEELSSGLLFSKDFRYLQAMLCDFVLNLADLL